MNVSGTNLFTGTVNTNSSNFTLASTGVLNGGTTGVIVIGDNGNFTVNGGSITVAGFTTNSKGTSATTINTGSLVNISGVLALDNNNGANGSCYFTILGTGVVNANSVIVGRTGYSPGGSTNNVSVTAGQTAQGIYINGGTLNVTTTLTLGTAGNGTTNSSPNVRMDSGVLNVGGLTTATINNARYSILDIAGGTFNGWGASSWVASMPGPTRN